jgi:hypothetical protein
VVANNLRSVLWEFFEWFLFFTLLISTPGNVTAAEPLINPTTADQLKQLNDQTIIATHVSLDSEWDHFSKWLGASFNADYNHSVVAAAVTSEVAYNL